MTPPQDTSNTSGNRDVVTELRIEFAEIKRDMLHLTSSFQELNVQLTEFIEKQDEKITQITNTCLTRSARFTDLITRVDALEEDKKNIEKRVEAIEKVHTEEEGGRSAMKPYKEYFLYIFMTATSVAEGAIILYLLSKGGLG